MPTDQRIEIPARGPAIAAHIATALSQRGWSVPTLAARSGVDASMLYKLLAGVRPEPSVWTMYALAQALEMTVEALITEKIVKRP